jgi:hypothetical protein
MPRIVALRIAVSLHPACLCGRVSKRLASLVLTMIIFSKFTEVRPTLAYPLTKKDRAATQAPCLSPGDLLGYRDSGDGQKAPAFFAGSAWGVLRQ